VDGTALNFGTISHGNTKKSILIQVNKFGIFLINIQYQFLGFKIQKISGVKIYPNL